MFRLYVVRHGEDQDNKAGILNGRRNTELTELGREQAIKAARYLRNKNISLIYSSPLARAYQTSCIIAEQLKIKRIIISHDLIERDFGILTGKKVSDIQKYSSKILFTEKVDYFLEAKEAEDFPTVFLRAKQFLERMQELFSKRFLETIPTPPPEQNKENVVIVTHGDIGKMIYAAFLGWSWEEALTEFHFDNGDVLDLQELAKQKA